VQEEVAPNHLVTFDDPYRREQRPRAQRASMKEAIEQTKRFLRIHGNEWNIHCEVRQMEGPDCAAEA
jgi:hypothetical protein